MNADLSIFLFYQSPDTHAGIHAVNHRLCWCSLLQLIDLQSQSFCIVIIRPFLTATHCNDAVFFHKNRNGQITAGFFIPLAALIHFSRKEMGPDSLWQIKFRPALFIKNGRCQHGISEEILFVQEGTVFIFRIFQYHAPHYGYTGSGSLDGIPVQIRHQLCL